MQINGQSLRSLMAEATQNETQAHFVAGAVQSFMDYYNAIYTMEAWLMTDPARQMDAEEYRDAFQQQDQRRRAAHQRVLSNLTVLNRMADQRKLPPIYDGQISEEKPYRREAADAVLAFVHQIVANRR